MTSSMTPAPPIVRQEGRATECGDSTFSRLRLTLDSIRENDFVSAAHECCRALRAAEGSLRRVQYLVVRQAYKLAERLYEDDALWEKFQLDDFWDGHCRLDRTHCLRYVLFYLCGNYDDRRADRARYHARALMGLWRDGYTAQEAYERLCAVGFAGLKAASKSKDRARPKEPRRSRRFFEVDQRIGARVERLQPGDEAVVHVRVDEKKGRLVLVATRLIPKVGEAIRSKPSSRERVRDRSPARAISRETQPRTCSSTTSR